MSDETRQRTEPRGTGEPVENACPRCGGAPAAARKVSRFNPFLPNPKLLTCSDCGLSYTATSASASR